MTKSIKLYRGNAGWQAVWSDPQVKELFGTDTIPTAYTKTMPKSEVLRRVRALNPGCIVEAWGQEYLGESIQKMERMIR